MARSGKMSKRAAGRLGGLATKSRHGSAHYSRIGHQGGGKGGRRTLERYGRRHFSLIGKGGARARWRKK